MTSIQIASSAQQTVFRNINTYTQKQGLSSPNISKILQDKYGYLWIATQDGLNRFNGRTFTIYNKDLHPQKQLLTNTVREILLADDLQTLWVVGSDGGISTIDLATGDVTRNYPYDNLDLRQEWRICATLYNEKMYIGTSAGLEIFNTLTGHFEAVPATLTALFRSLNSTEIWTISTDHNGICWIGVAKYGLLLYDTKSQQLLKTIRADTFLSANDAGNFWPKSSAFTSGDTYWLGSTQGLFRIRYDRHYRTSALPATIPFSSPSTTSTITEQVFTGKEGQLLIPGSSLHQYNPHTRFLQTLQPADQQYSSWLMNTTYIFEDNQCNIWVGCKQGLALIGPEPSPFLPTRNGEHYQNKLGHVYALQPLAPDNMLAGTEDGLWQVRGQQITLLYGQGRVQNIFHLTPTDLLISGKAGIRLYSNNRVLPVHDQFLEFKPYAQWQFNSIGHLNDSMALIGTESNAGVLLWNKHRHQLTHLQKASTSDAIHLTTNNVNTIYIDRQQRAIVLSDYSIAIYNPADTTFKTVLLRDPRTQQPMGVFMEITETKDHYWISAYSHGLLQLNKNWDLIRKYGLKDGLTNTGVYELFNYKDSLLYLTSNFGITTFQVANKQLSQYYEEDGLQHNTFEEASGVTYNGHFYAGGSNGWVEIDPSQLAEPITIPALSFTGITLQQSGNRFIDTVNLAANTYTIGNNVLQTTVHFNGLNYINPHRVHYQYKIAELKDEWIDLGTQNSIQLLGLSPGTYHLQVRAANSEPNWSQPRELVLRFEPQWFQTWWFRVLVSFLIAMLIYLAYRYRLYQLQKQQHIRKEIAADLHDNLGSTLNSIKIFANLALNKIQTETNLQQIVKSMEQATAELRDMLWVLDDNMDTVDELITRLNQFAAPVSAAVNIETSIKTSFETGKRRLTKKEKSNLLLICKEAINNSIKYSQATHINILISSKGNQLQVLITDNGTGFNLETVKKGYGLQNIQYRARQIRYQVNLNTMPGAGTRIAVSQTPVA
ncbi:ligand-binding sensor domain-containing protein [Paraflavitalea pollutisoli]|uniref:ligand-binding sensor domain-containing protein n=1 Tax=Paraflavitalea pollutisoli TaxID=3034143 RepID=UPI0023EBF6FA|nr:sensor histidine kinase [Paraflavitalea sp. H1-2-19X]